MNRTKRTAVILYGLLAGGCILLAVVAGDVCGAVSLVSVFSTPWLIMGFHRLMIWIDNCERQT